MTDTGQNNNEKFLKVFIINKHSGTVLSDEALLPAFHTIFFILSGSLDICIDNTLKTFLAFDLILIPNNIPFKIPNSNTNLKLYIISFSPELLLNSNTEKFNSGYCLLLTTKFIVIPLSREDIPFLKKIIKLIYTSQNTNNHQFQKDLLSIGINFLMQKQVNSYKIYTGGQKQKIISDFFKHLEQNYKKEHRVKFYADALCITTGYLNKITKERTGKTTKRLIEEAIITESKILLYNNNLNISEIAEILHFSSCSSFSSFFKKHTSFSPSDYRFKTL